MAFGMELDKASEKAFAAQLKNVLAQLRKDAASEGIPLKMDLRYSDLEKLIDFFQEARKTIAAAGASLDYNIDTLAKKITHTNLTRETSFGGMRNTTVTYDEKGMVVSRKISESTRRAKQYSTELNNLYNELLKKQKALIDIEVHGGNTTSTVFQNHQKEVNKLKQDISALIKEWQKWEKQRGYSKKYIEGHGSKAQVRAKERKNDSDLDVYRLRATQTMQKQQAQAFNEYFAKRQQEVNLEVELERMKANSKNYTQEAITAQERLVSEKHQEVAFAEQNVNWGKVTEAQHQQLVTLTQSRATALEQINSKSTLEAEKQRLSYENQYLDALQRQYNEEVKLEKMKTDPKHRYGSETIASQQALVDLLQKQTQAASQNVDVNNLSAEATERKARMEAQYKAQVDAANGSLVVQQGFLKSFVQNFKNTFKQVVTAGLSWKIWAQGVKILRNAVETVTKIDTAMVELKKVTDETDEAYSKFLKNAKNDAKALGATIDELIQSTAGFARLGYSITEAADLAKVATIYTRVGDEVENVEQATSTLVSTMKAFGLEAKDAMKIIDIFNEVGNNFAVTSGGLGVALERSASSLMTAGNTLEESVGLIVAMDEIIQDASKTGTALKTISMRLRNTAGQLEELDEDAEGAAESITKLQTQILNITSGRVNIMFDNDTFKSTTQILTELSQVWQDLTDIQRADLTRLIAGRHQGNAFNAVMTNMSKGIEATTTALHSNGSAMKEHTKWLDSIQGATYQFEASLQKLYSNLIDSELIKFIIRTGTVIVDVVDALHLIPIAVNAIIALGIPKLLTSAYNHIKNITLAMLANAKATTVSQLQLQGMTSAEVAALLVKKQMNIALITATGAENKQNVKLLEQQLILAGLTKTQAQEVVTLIKENQLRELNAKKIDKQTKAQKKNRREITLMNSGFGGLKSTLKGFFTSFSGWVTIITVAVGAFMALKEHFGWFKSFKERTEEYNKKVEEVTQAYTEQKQVIEDINKKIKEYNEEYSSLFANAGKLTLRETERASYLETEITKLNEKLTIEQDITNEKRKQAELGYTETLADTQKEINKYKVSNIFSKEKFRTFYTDEGKLNEEAFKKLIQGLLPDLNSAELNRYFQALLNEGDFKNLLTGIEDPEIQKSMRQIYRLRSGVSLAISSGLDKGYEYYKTMNQSTPVDTATWMTRLQTLENIYENAVDATIRNTAESQIKNIYQNILSSELYDTFDKFIGRFTQEQKDEIVKNVIGLDPEAAKKYLKENFAFIEEAAGKNWDDYVNELINLSKESYGAETAFADLTTEELEKHFKNLSSALKQLNTVQSTFTKTNTYSREELGELRTALGLTENQVAELAAVIAGGNEKEVTRKLKALAAQYTVNEYNMKQLTEQTKQKIAIDLKYLGITGDLEELYDLLNKKTSLQTQINHMLQQELNATNEKIQEFLDNLVNLEGAGALPEGYEKDLENAQKKYENNIYTTEEYYNELLRIQKKYKKDLQSLPDAWESLQKEISKIQKAMIEEQNDLAEATRNYIEYLVNKKIKALDAEQEALEKKNDEEERALNLEKAKQKAQQKTMRVWYEDRGWVWEVNPEDKQAYEQAQKEYATDSIEAEKDSWKARLDALDTAEEEMNWLWDRAAAETLLGKETIAAFESGKLSIDDLLRKYQEATIGSSLAGKVLDNSQQYKAFTSSGTSLPSGILNFVNEVMSDPSKAFNKGLIQKLVDTVNSTSITIQNLNLPSVTDANSLVHQLQLMSNNH